MNLGNCYTHELSAVRASPDWSSGHLAIWASPIGGLIEVRILNNTKQLAHFSD